MKLHLPACARTCGTMQWHSAARAYLCTNMLQHAHPCSMLPQTTERRLCSHLSSLKRPKGGTPGEGLGKYIPFRERERERERYIYTYMHTYMHTYIHAHKHTCTQAYIHTCIRTYARTVHTYIHTCIHTCMHTYILTYMHACMHA